MPKNSPTPIPGDTKGGLFVPPPDSGLTNARHRSHRPVTIHPYTRRIVAFRSPQVLPKRMQSQNLSQSRNVEQLEWVIAACLLLWFSFTTIPHAWRALNTDFPNYYI